MTAIRSWIADEFVPLIESLGSIKGLLRAEAEQTIGMPLKFCKVVKQRGLHPPGLRRQRLDDRFPGMSTQDNQVGFLAIGRQSRCVRLSLVVLGRLCLGTKPRPLITFLLLICPSLKGCDTLHVVLGDKAPQSQFAIDNH